MSNELDRITSSKGYFQNKDALLADYPDFFSAQDIERLSDSRIKPYLFNKRWFPFAEYCDSCYLMLDMNPGDDGKVGQIICYIHDPDEVVYVSESLENSFLRSMMRYAHRSIKQICNCIKDKEKTISLSFF